MEDTDLLLVNRELKTYKQPVGEIMAKVEDNDYLLVNRDDQTYKISGAEFKNSLKPDDIFPDGTNMVINPAPLSGTGTAQDPYVLRVVQAGPAGASVTTVEQITFFNEAPEAPVVWNATNASRFKQPVSATDVNGEWSGHLNYTDEPESITDQTYESVLSIGTVNFRWQVEQYVNAFTVPDINTVTITKSRQGSGGGRFTDCDFLINANMNDNGIPPSIKTYIIELLGVTAVYQYTGPVTSYNDSTNRINFNNPTPEGFENFSVGDAIVSLQNTINYGPAASINATRSVNPGYSYETVLGPSQRQPDQFFGTWTVPDGANYATVCAIGGGGGATGAGDPYSDGFGAFPGPGGGGAGVAFISNVDVVPGETINYEVGCQGGAIDGDYFQDPVRDGGTSRIYGNNFDIYAYGGKTPTLSSSITVSGGAGGGSNVVAGTTGAGAINGTSGEGTGGRGGDGKRCNVLVNVNGTPSARYGSWGGGGGGAAGRGCDGGNGTSANPPQGAGDWVNPNRGGSGGGFDPFGTQGNSCNGGTGGTAAYQYGPGTPGNPAGQAGFGAGGVYTSSIDNGGHGRVHIWFSQDGDRDLENNININYETGTFEYDIEMGAGFNAISYSLKLNDNIQQGNNVGKVVAINGNVITLQSVDAQAWDVAGDFVNLNGQASGTIASISSNPGATFFEVSSSNDRWVPDMTAQSPNKINPDGTTVVYGSLASDGETVNGLALNPTTYTFTPDELGTSMTLKFPETFDTGRTPDAEIPDGTTMTIDLTATNVAGSDNQKSDPLQREGGVITFNADETINHISDEDNDQLKLNAATFEVRALAARKAALDAALLAEGFTQQQLDDTYAN